MKQIIAGILLTIAANAATAGTLEKDVRFQCILVTNVEPDAVISCVVMDPVHEQAVNGVAKTAIPAGSRFVGSLAGGEIEWTRWATPEGKTAEIPSGAMRTKYFEKRDHVSIVLMKDLQLQ